MPRSAVRASSRAARWSTQAVTASARTSTPWKTAIPPKASAPGSGPRLREPGRAQPVYTKVSASTAREANGSARTTRWSEETSGASSLRAVRQTTIRVAAASTMTRAVSARPVTARTGWPPSPSAFAAAASSTAATVSTPAVVCAARSLATSRRPYQKPSRLSAVRSATGVSREVPGSRGGGEADS